MSGRLRVEGTGSRNPNVQSQVQHPKMEILTTNFLPNTYSTLAIIPLFPIQNLVTSKIGLLGNITWKDHY